MISLHLARLRQRLFAGLFGSARRPIRRQAGACARVFPRLELLEDRLAPAIVTVTTLSDALSHSGMSLRDAIGIANPGDTIQFQAGLRACEKIPKSSIAGLPR